ncbi:putative SP-containing membrane protein [Vairimorpha necatrix]|uniref:SP-containing membrane protein n=1 Tax=Vairimorpha necatrix TaxID=6039 RepID=A0AAX4J843_9MICR
MVCKIFLYFLFGCSKITFFVNHKENNVCDGYVGFSKEVDIYDEVKIFLSYDLNILEIKIDSNSYVADIVTLVSEFGLPLFPIDMKEFEELRRLGSNIQDSELRNYFNDSVKYFKCSFNCDEYKTCFLEYILYDAKTNNVSWAHSSPLFLDKNFISGNSCWQNKCDLKIDASSLDRIIEYLNKKCDLDTPNVLREIKNEKIKKKLLLQDELVNSSSIKSWGNMITELDIESNDENQQNNFQRTINDHNHNKTEKKNLNDSNVNMKTGNNNNNKKKAKPSSNRGPNNNNSKTPDVPYKGSLRYYHYVIMFLVAALSVCIYSKYKSN